MELVVVEDGPHGIPWTRADRVNAALSASSATRPPEPPVPVAPARSRSGHRPFSLRFQRLSRRHGTALVSGQCRRRELPVHLG